MFFSCYPDFSLFSLKFPIGFNQTQVRFASLVNLEIFLGGKKPGFWGVLFKPKGKKGALFAKQVFPSSHSSTLCGSVSGAGSKPDFQTTWKVS